VYDLFLLFPNITQGKNGLSICHRHFSL